MIQYNSNLIRLRQWHKKSNKKKYNNYRFVIQLSVTDYTSPVVPVRKKGYEELNWIKCLIYF